jgi:hypothetical protein
VHSRRRGEARSQRETCPTSSPPPNLTAKGVETGNTDDVTEATIPVVGRTGRQNPDSVPRSKPDKGLCTARPHPQFYPPRHNMLYPALKFLKVLQTARQV